MKTVPGFVLSSVLCLLFLSPGACDGMRNAFQKKEKPAVAAAPELPPVPPALAGTVEEVAVLVGGEDLSVQGFGLVVGLMGNGSSEVPPAIRERLITQMRKYGIGSATAGLDILTPDRLLEDTDTAVVQVWGAIPPGVPKGTQFDVSVRALDGTQTVSLDGGTLMSTELAMVAAQGNRAVESHALAVGRGDLFVNPFLDVPGGEQSARLRQGRILGGGVVSESRPLELVLRRPDQAVVRRVEQAINQRFPSSTPVARALRSDRIALRIPPRYEKDYQHFLQLVMHVFWRRGEGVLDLKMHTLAEEIVKPDAPAEDIALVWEAIGRPALPTVRALYTSDNPVAAYFAARTGARLEDTAAADVLMRAAREEGSPFQMDAIAELGLVIARSQDLQSVQTLRDLLDSHNDLVRVAAYEALADSGLAGAVEQYVLRDVDGNRKFELHVVPSTRNPMIYATQTMTPRIVLFGRDLRVRSPLFFAMPDDMVTIHGRGDEDQVHLYRRVGKEHVLSDQSDIPNDVRTLVLTLGAMPEPVATSEPAAAAGPTITTRGALVVLPSSAPASAKYRNLGLTYSQVVSVLYRLTRQGAIPARFVLQTAPQTRRIYENMVPAERPNTTTTAAAGGP